MLKRNILFFGICAVFTSMMFTSCKNADGDIVNGDNEGGAATESGTAVDSVLGTRNNLVVKVRYRLGSRNC